MEIKRNVSLVNYSTMKLGGPAALLVEVTTVEDLMKAARQAKNTGLPLIVIGYGSNIIWSDSGFPGLVIVNRIKGYSIVSDDKDTCYINIGAGELWDSVVDRAVSAGLSGIECLSLIPGTAGATPIQNVGAYGQEIASTLVTLRAYDSLHDQMITLTGSDCAFSYRSSRFNATDKDRFFITSITLMLSKFPSLPPFYPALSSYLEANNIKDYSPSSLRQAIIAIRRQKLPDPAITPNNGSFFANPIVDQSTIETLRDSYPDIPNWEMDEGTYKLSAAWLIERTGYKDYFDKETGMATWPGQPLVFINRQAKSTNDLILFRDKIVTAVKQQFDINLVQEPEFRP